MKVNISEQLHNKINLLSSEYDIEVGGYLTGEIKNGEIFLQDLLIPSQSISSVSVNITPRDQIELRKKYGVAVVNKILGHWHSHHNMGCFWSGAGSSNPPIGSDMRNMNDIMMYRDLFVFIVSSKAKHLVRVCMSKPLKVNFEECELYLKSYRLDMLRAKMKALLRQNNHDNDIDNDDPDKEPVEDDEDDEDDTESELKTDRKVDYYG